MTVHTPTSDSIMTLDSPVATGTHADSASSAQAALTRFEASVAFLKSVMDLNIAKSDSAIDSVTAATRQLTTIVDDLVSTLAGSTPSTTTNNPGSVANEGSLPESHLELKVYPIHAVVFEASEDDDLYHPSSEQDQLRLLTNWDRALPTETNVPLRRAQDELLLELMGDNPRKTMIRGSVRQFFLDGTWHSKALDQLHDLSHDGWTSKLGVSLKVMSLDEAGGLASSKDVVSGLKSFDSARCKQ
jgi:hypothetical protein